MKKNMKTKFISIFLAFFIISSQINFSYAATSNRDQSISGIVEDGINFIAIRRRTRFSYSEE